MKSVSNGYSGKMTGCFMSASVSSHLPSRGPKEVGKYLAPHCQFSLVTGYDIMTGSSWTMVPSGIISCPVHYDTIFDTSLPVSLSLSYVNSQKIWHIY